MMNEIPVQNWLKTVAESTLHELNGVCFTTTNWFGNLANVYMFGRAAIDRGECAHFSFDAYVLGSIAIR